MTFCFEKKLKTAKKEYMNLSPETLSSNRFFWRTLPTFNKKKLKTNRAIFTSSLKQEILETIKNKLSKSTSSSMCYDNHACRDIINYRFRYFFLRKDFLETIKKLKKKSASPDGIPIVFFKKLSSEIIDHLIFLCNQCLENNFCPSQWCESHLVPICKPEMDPILANSYRPVALTSAFLRIFEKMLLKIIILNVKNSLSTEQYYAIPRRSCLTNLIKTKQIILENMENMRNTYVVYMDITAAFDSLDLDILLQRLLDHQSLDPIICYWLHTYLKRRISIIKFDECFSFPFPLTTGILQGSPLSAILFDIYIDPIFKIVKSKLLSYADDMKLLNYSHFRLQEELITINEWLRINKLILNKAKTKYVFYSSYLFTKTAFD